jgi:putative NADPH-quinone reductase
MNILAFNASPRRKGNTSLLLQQFIKGAREVNAHCEEIIAEETDLKYCKGCLRCNIIKRCSISGDDWGELSQKILAADTIVFASPVYFHHLTAPLKKILDRFRCFINVQLTEDGLIHTPYHQWNKQFILLLCLGSSDDRDAQPIIEVFTFITSILGSGNTLSWIIGKRLAIAGQVNMSEEKLAGLYPKLGLPSSFSKEDYRQNQLLLKKCYELGINAGHNKALV